MYNLLEILKLVNCATAILEWCQTPRHGKQDADIHLLLEFR